MDILQDNNLLDLQVTEETKTNLNSLSQWLNVNAIIALISLGISIISTIIAVGKLSRYSSGSMGGSIFIWVAISTGISLLMNLTLIAAAKNIKAGIAASDQGLFNLGIRKFNTYFLILGIIIIIVMVIVLLATLIFMIAQSRRGF